MASLRTWSEEMEPLGDAVMAIGVFDGVHVGHQSLLRALRREADRTAALACVLTFDRDPDELVRPLDPAPRLMDAETRYTALTEMGADVVLVVPFTERTLSLSPEAFLDAVVASAADVFSLHVGENFRFGANAAGDLETLYAWGVEHGVEVHPHPLVRMDGGPVTATRIRGLIASGNVKAAARLLGRPHAVKGVVHPGRGAGRGIGFPTANLTPSPGAALPARGVYAAQALSNDGRIWPAAVTVGAPPTFPDARDFFEAHLIGFEGDLVGETLTIRFIDRLRDQRAFGSVEALSRQIAEDVAHARVILDDSALPASASYLDEDGVPFVDDPFALEAAEREVAGLKDPSKQSYAQFHEGWVPVYGPARLASLFRDGGASSALITGRLTAAGVPFVWDPFPPSAAQTSRPDFNWIREFTLLVPPEHEHEARELLAPFTG